MVMVTNNYANLCKLAIKIINFRFSPLFSRSFINFSKQCLYYYKEHFIRILFCTTIKKLRLNSTKLYDYKGYW